MQNYLLSSSVGPEELPTLKELSNSEIWKIWSGASRYIHRQLLQKRAVETGVGTFAIVPVHASVEEGKVLTVERPVFIVNKQLRTFYNLECEETKIPDETPVVQLDFGEIAADTHFRREIVELCVHETLLCFAGALADEKEVEFSFKGIGILAVRGKVVSMTFFDHCVLEPDVTGNMLKALLRDSNMMRIVAFPGQNDFNRVSRDEVITLPSLVVETPHQPWAPLISLKPSRESAPWGGGSRRVSVLDPVFLARRRVSQASQQSVESDRPKDKEAGRGGFLPVIQEKTDKMLMHPTPQSESRSKLPKCAPRPSAMGMHSLYNEREERELQLLMASRRHEVEGEVWRKYFGNRTRQITELGETSCPYVFEDPYRPPYLLRKAYAEKLKEKGRSTARQSTLEQQEELQLPRKVLEDKGVQTGLLEHRWDSPGTASFGKKM
ncbi:coiled-coil domain-containing protein 81-like isoform X8 [Manacus candei]|uniref:coiled-coil domain-containing protein 81-like isoform X8 n=1 Tax=Manacus candei TaxID=415023 RepID=UPI002225DE9E|nr:coiled-coil domain-containing protein 81-like isoform X8 [Manacus candei]